MPDAQAQNPMEQTHFDLRPTDQIDAGGNRPKEAAFPWSTLS